MRILRVQITNFRNFKKLDVLLAQHAVIVGENKVGKSNFLYALRLVLDPALPDTARQLRDEDFWDGIKRPLSVGERIVISVDLTEYEENQDLLAILAEHVISTDPMVSRLTYEFGVRPDVAENSVTEKDYDFTIYGGDRPENQVGWDLRRRIPMDLLPALRDAEGDLANWRRSPLRPLLDEAAGRIDRAELVKLADEVSEATEKLTATSEISTLSEQIADRLKTMVGEKHAIATTLGFSPSDPQRLLRALRLFIDDGKRGIGEASLGSANLLYITLKALELENLVIQGNRHHTFLAIEEPEAHLHPHLQRLVYRDFLRPRAHQLSGDEPDKRDVGLVNTILLTTHSPHIASVSPLDSFVLLRKNAADSSTTGSSTAGLSFAAKTKSDLERYLDVTRGEILFAKGVVLVEGDAESFIVPALAKLLGYDLDALGISVCSVGGTHFSPYVQFIGPSGLGIPFVVLTDFDPTKRGGLGEKRVADLLTLLGYKNIPPKGAALKTFAAATGLFLNDFTLEVDLFKCGRHNSIAATLTQLSESKIAATRAAGWKNNPQTLNVAEFLNDIKTIGKGRFAQRLATNMTGPLCPDYIKDALAYVTALCS